MEDPTQSGVIESDPQAGDDNNTDSPDQNQGADDSGAVERQSRENRIPQSRVEEMWKRREEKLRETMYKEWEDKHLNPLRTQQQEMIKQFQDAEKARLRALGLLQDEKPEPLTRADLEKQMKQMQDQFQQNLNQMYHGQRISEAFQYAQEKYPKLLENPDFGEMVMALYSKNPRKTPKQHIEELAKWMYGLGKANREERNAPDRRIMPAGRGSTTGASQQEKGRKKQTIADKIRAKLHEQDED